MVASRAWSKVGVRDGLGVSIVHAHKKRRSSESVPVRATRGTQQVVNFEMN
ncbi:hypothetical protein PS708_02526 [Pseudomonas fluorescens]|nr:hypothetical protein PS708_02526 [Pseudomonas fluorescens]